MSKFLEIDSSFRAEGDNFNDIFNCFKFEISTDINSANIFILQGETETVRRQQTEYIVSLKEIILPTSFIVTIDGVDFLQSINEYQFIYVKFRNKGEFANQNFISCNPESYDCQFRVPIPGDVYGPHIILSSSMTAQITLNLYDDLEFEVVLPYGNIISPDPAVPDTVSCVFELKPITPAPIPVYEVKPPTSLNSCL